MRRLLLAVVLLALASPVFAQSLMDKEAEIRSAVPYSRMLRSNPGLTLLEYNQAVRRLAEKEIREEQSSSPTYSVPNYTPRTYTPPVYTPPPLYVPPSTSRSRSYTPSSGSTYDWQSGNSYTWRKSLSGDTNVNGWNVNTGSMWNTTIKPNGSMNGYDSQMNPWTYDSRTKTYINYGTGKMCVGEGATRVCS